LSAWRRIREECNAGFTGPNGGPCLAFEAGKYEALADVHKACPGGSALAAVALALAGTGIRDACSERREFCF